MSELTDGDVLLPKPPMGILPQAIWRQQMEDARQQMEDARINDLMHVIIRFRNAGKPVSREWVDELQELVSPQPMFTTSWEKTLSKASRARGTTATENALADAVFAFSQWRSRALRYLRTLLAIRSAIEHPWSKTQGVRAFKEDIVQAICDCWKEERQVCDFCQGTVLREPKDLPRQG